jgi:hypothetical protein
MDAGSPLACLLVSLKGSQNLVIVFSQPTLARKFVKPSSGLCEAHGRYTAGPARPSKPPSSCYLDRVTGTGGYYGS